MLRRRARIAIAACVAVASALGAAWAAVLYDPRANDADLALGPEPIGGWSASDELIGAAIVLGHDDLDVHEMDATSEGHDVLLRWLDDRLDDLRRALETPRLRFSDERRRSGDSWIARFTVVARLIQLRAARAMMRGDVAAARSDALLAAKLGAWLERAWGASLSIHHGGAVVKRIGLASLRRTLRAPVDTDDFVALARDRFRSLREPETALQDVFRVEYQTACELTDDVHEKKQAPRELGVEAIPSGFVALIGWSFRPNATKALFLNDYREAEALAGCDTYARASESAAWLAKMREAAKPVTDSTRNALGIRLHDALAPNPLRVIGRRARTEADVAATEILIALRAFKDAHGELPATLDELAPKFIERVPRDPFDGAPMRYSRENRTVWAIGGDPQGNDEDLVFPIEF